MLKYAIFFLSCFTLSASAQEQFFKLFDKNNDNNFAASIEKFTDSSWIVFVNSWDQFNSGPVQSATLIIKRSGDKIIDQYYSNLSHNNYPNDIIVDQSGIMHLIAHNNSIDNSQVYLYLTKLDGDSITLKSYGGTGSDLAYEMVKFQNHYYLTGLTDSFDSNELSIYLIKTDTLGNLIWQKTYGCVKTSWVQDIEVTFDGNLILAGTTNCKLPDDTLGVKAYVLKIDTAGSLLWQESINENPQTYVGVQAHCITTSKDGGYIIGGFWDKLPVNSPFLAKLDSVGKPVWIRQMSVAEGLKEEDGGGFNAVAELPDGSIVAAGAITYMDSMQNKYRGDACLWKFAANGKTIWRRTYDGGVQNLDEGGGAIYDMQLTDDGGFIMCGRLAYDSFYRADAIVIKVDSFGCLEPGCQLIDGINTLADQLLQVKAYPNPSKGALSFSWNQALQKESTLLISDLTGRTVYTKILHPSETRHNLQKGLLKEGMYLYRLQGPGLNSTAGKLIITE